MIKRLLLLMLFLVAGARAESMGSLPRTIAWSHAGQLMAVVTNDHIVSVYDLSSSRRLYTLESDRATSLAFSPDGEKLAISRVGEWLFLHRARTGERLWKSGSGRKPEDSRYTGLSVFFLPDGQLVSTGTGQGRSAPDPYLRWYDPATGKQVRKMFSINAFATRDLKYAALSAREKIEIIELATGKMLRTLKLEDRVHSVGFLEPGQKFILQEVGPLEGPKHGPSSLTLVDVASGKEERLDKVPPVIGSMPDGRLIRAYGDGIYDPASGKTVVTKGWPQDCAGTLAVVDDLSGTLRVLDCRTGQLKFTLPYGPSKAFFSPDGKRLAVGTATELVVYDTTSWKPVARFP